MDPDLQQAESERYSNAAFFVLPLDSGRIAVLSPRRTIYQIVESWDEARAAGPLAHRADLPRRPIRYTDTGITVDLSSLL